MFRKKEMVQLRIEITQEDMEAIHNVWQECLRDANDAKMTMSEAHNSGDGWHDNVFIISIADEAAKRKTAAELELLIKCVTVVETVEQNERVMLGNTVILRYPDGSTKEFLVVGTAIGDRGVDVLSARAPLGKQLLGRAKGDKATLPNGKEVEIVGIISPSAFRSRQA